MKTLEVQRGLRAAFLFCGEISERFAERDQGRFGEFGEEAMKTGRSSFKTCKERGEWAELCFMARAAERGFSVSRPHGDSAAYDVGVEDKGRFLRVQVKSTTFRRKGSYTCNVVGARRERYSKSAVDFFAVYLVPIDLWYIIPFEVMEKNLSLNLTPRKGCKFCQYMEGWELMRGGSRLPVGSSRLKARG